MSIRTDVVIIGAGQAGLAMSQRLSARGIDHVVLERGRIGERWLSERWPSLRLLSPNWMTRLPGLHLGSDPDGFMGTADFAATLGRYRDEITAPVVTGCEVLSLGRGTRGFHVRTSRGDWSARAVVVATGACDTPAIPDWSANLPRDIRQLSTQDYRGADQLAPGGVLVVGASATGVQIAAEIQSSGRPVTLSVGRHVRVPRRYRGRDLFHWLDRSGFLSERRDPDADDRRLLALPSLQLVGNDDGRDIGLDQLAEAGVRIAGRAVGASGGQVHFAQTLTSERAGAEARRRTLLSVIDDHIAASGLDASLDPLAWEAPAALSEGPEALDLRTAGIRTVIWATGFTRCYPWLDLPVLDGFGEIVNRGGVTPVPGLYVLGMPFMRRRSSAFIYGAGRDAEAIAGTLAQHLSHPRRHAA